MGLVALNDLVPGGRAPQPPTPPHPIRPIGPGLPQKAGVSLFVATATPSQRVATRSSRAHRDRLSVSRRLVSWQ